MKNDFDLILFEIPKKSEYFSCLRLNTSGLANILAFTIDDINDIKLIVTEVCNFFMKNIPECTENLSIEYKIYENKLTMRITDKNKIRNISKKDIEDNEMFVLIMDSLTDEFDIDYQNNSIELDINK